MEITIATAEADIAECLRLREIVFIGEQNVPEFEERDGLDDACTHLLARRERRSVGAARLNLLNADYAKIQRVCVLSDARGSGVGAALIRYAVGIVRQGNLRGCVRLGAQTHALEFYRKLGFRAFGPEYLDAGIPHFDMELKV